MLNVQHMIHDDTLNHNKIVIDHLLIDKCVINDDAVNIDDHHASCV